MGINQGSFMAVQLFDSETASQLVSIARGVSFRKIQSLIFVETPAKGLTGIFP